MNKLIILLFLLPIFCFCQEKEDPKHRVKIGDIAPDFVINYTDGKTCKLSELRGKVVMLQFTASWCSVCLKEMPFIESEIWQKYKNNKNFALIGIDLKEDTSLINKFTIKAGVTYPITLDPEGTKFDLYAEKDAGVTRNIIIDKNGKIVFLTRLFDRNEFDAMKEKIAELLK
jgi:peroxiredoxin